MKSAVWDDNELSTIQNVDRMLPSQPYFSKMYNGKDFYGDMEKTLAAVREEKKWDIQTKEGMTYAVMGSDINTLHFYQFLIRSHGYRRVLELGTYIGVSAMYMAEAAHDVVTVEKGEEFWNIAKRNVNVNSPDKDISLYNYDAIEWLREPRPNYDFILIDCAKESYKELLELSLPILSPNGTIIVDDVFFQGDTLNETPTSEKGRGVKAMLDYVETLTDYEKVILPIGNGLLMLRKK